MQDYSGYSLEGADFTGKNVAGKEFRGIRYVGCKGMQSLHRSAVKYDHSRPAAGRLAARLSAAPAVSTLFAAVREPYLSMPISRPHPSTRQICQMLTSAVQPHEPYRSPAPPTATLHASVVCLWSLSGVLATLPDVQARTSLPQAWRRLVWMAPSLQVEANLPKPRRAYRGRCCPFSPSHRPFALDANLQSAYLTKTIGDDASIKGAAQT